MIHIGSRRHRLSPSLAPRNIEPTPKSERSENSQSQRASKHTRNNTEQDKSDAQLSASVIVLRYGHQRRNQMESRIMNVDTRTAWPSRYELYCRSFLWNSKEYNQVSNETSRIISLFCYMLTWRNRKVHLSSGAWESVGWTWYVFHDFNQETLCSELDYIQHSPDTRMISQTDG